MLNEVKIIGRMGSDPEMRQTRDGKPIANFSVATSEKWKDSAGQQQEQTEWHRVVCFKEATAGFIGQYARKGDLVYLCGQLQTRKWTDKDGIERYSTEIVIRSWGHQFDKLASPTGGNRPPPPQGESDYGQTRPSGRPQAAAYDQGGADDDIPF